MASAEPSRILVADDDRDILVPFRIYLEHKGVTVRTVDNCDEVPDEVKRFKPDVLILDVMMPSRWGIDGFEVCRFLKKNLGKNCPKIILHSAIVNELEQDPERLRQQLQADAFLVKPVDLPDVWRTVESLCEKNPKK